MEGKQKEVEGKHEEEVEGKQEEAGLAFLAFPALFLALKSVETELVKKSALHACSDIRVRC